MMTRMWDAWFEGTGDVPDDDDGDDDDDDDDGDNDDDGVLLLGSERATWGSASAHCNSAATLLE
jgi:hypothetical protein